MPDELPTHDFIVKWSASKTILLPVVKGEQMVVRKFTGIEDLKKGHYKTLEPGSTTHSRNIAQLVIAPGIAFDKEKRRLGRGGGYYDKYLKNKDIPTWGIGFSFQLFDQIPAAPFDVQMTKVITPDLIVE
jgi:5-formyltetrahydrofolate cyclo-ligase